MNIETKDAIPSAILRAVGGQLQRKLSAPLLQVANGELSVEDAALRAFSVFLQSHANARYAGRLAAGDKSPIGEADRESVRLLAQEQQTYFKRFAAQLLGGKYRDAQTGELNAAAISDRAGLYALRLQGTANDGWAVALDSDDLVEWVLGGTENHCSICPDLAENGPYKPNELPTTPKSNETPCLWNCRCTLRSTKGFSPPKSFAPFLTFSPQFQQKHAALCACRNQPLFPSS